VKLWLTAQRAYWKKLLFIRLVRSYNALCLLPPRRQELEQVMHWVGPVSSYPPGSGDRSDRLMNIRLDLATESDRLMNIRLDLATDRLMNIYRYGNSDLTTQFGRHS